ncbi:MAG TPA: AbrB/MazE/SpoVT family DNA-binding domain-containing protein [Candidatus Lokiarchaeia archaeon]|nr:AbrB/MazE/SpoVT family DNA-binding domain-containing protein [Candidatus Lokiarchaeia archaeon]
MELEKVNIPKSVTITNRGMITIPAHFRKQYHLKDGDKVFVVEDEGALKIIPIRSEEELRENSYTTKEILESIQESKREELERENE